MDTIKTNQHNEIRAQYLTASQCHLAASLLYQAYHDDKQLKTLLKFDERKEQVYEAKLRALIREELASYWQTKQPIVGLFHDEHLLAVACLIIADGPLKAERQWHWRLKTMLSSGYISTTQLIQKEAKLRQALEPMGRYGYLSFFAVDPHVQQQGYGRYLLRAVDDVTKTHNLTGSAVYITDPNRVSIFAEEGFEQRQVLKFEHFSGEVFFKPNSYYSKMEVAM